MSLSTQLFFFVVLLLLLPSMTAFSYVGLFLSSECDFFTFFAWDIFHPALLEWLFSEQFAELGSVHLLAFSARACSLSFLSSVSPFFGICRAVFIYLVLFGGLSSLLSLFSDSVDFSYSEGSFFLFFSGIFHASSTVLSFFLLLFFLARRHCLLRMYVINSCLGDARQRHWCDISPIMVNRS